jgi:pimeloyl-ACP methyl ester carboxylesterase
MPVLTGPALRTNYQTLGPALEKGRAPIAMIHGLGANLAFWYLGAAPHMGRDHTLLMHDMRGHGASSMPEEGYGLSQLAEDFRALLDDLDVETVHVVGHSHGARVALAFAMAYPERVASLTLADTQLRALQDPMRLRDWPHWARWKADLATQGVDSFPDDDAVIDFRVLAQLGPRGRAGANPLQGKNALAGIQAGLGAAAGAQADSAEPANASSPLLLLQRGPLARLVPAKSRGIDLRSRQMGVRSSQKWQKLLEKTSASGELDDETPILLERLVQLQVPTLLMYGEASHCVPTSDRLLELLPDVRRIMVPGAGHFFPLVKPRAFSRGLRAFVNRSETTGAAPRRRLATRLFAGRG